MLRVMCPCLAAPETHEDEMDQEHIVYAVPPPSIVRSDHITSLTHSVTCEEEIDLDLVVFEEKVLVTLLVVPRFTPRAPAPPLFLSPYYNHDR